MISNAYIHSTDLQEEFLFESHHLLNSISDEMQKLIGLEQEIEEAAMFGESVEDYIPYYEAESKNIFERIGESLISLTKSFIKMVSDIVAKIKNAIGSSQKVAKSNAIKEAINANPGLADEFLRSVTAGNIKCNDVKDFDELVSEAAKISKDYANGKLGKQSFSDKMDNILANFSRKAKPIAEILGVGTAATALILNIDKISKFGKNQTQSAQEITVKISNMTGDCIKIFNEKKRKKPDVVKESEEETVDIGFLAAKHRELMAAVSRSYSSASKVTDKMNSFLSKISNKSTEKN